MNNTAIGVGLLVMAVVFLLGDRLNFVGNLPGDLHFKVGNATVFIPLGTGLVVSILVSLVVTLFSRE